MRIGTWAQARPAAALVACGWLALGCTLTGARQTTTPAQASAATSAVPTPTAATAPPASEATLSPAPSPVPTAQASTPDASFEPPPDGYLGYDDDAPGGWLGSWCWESRCLDAPRIPAKDSLPKETGSPDAEVRFSVDYERSVGFTRWSAAYQSSSGAQPIELASGGQETDPDASASTPPATYLTSFTGPPRGDWILTVAVGFANGGDAVYAWHVVVS